MYGAARCGLARQRNREVNPLSVWGSDDPPLMSVVDRARLGLAGRGVAWYGSARLGRVRPGYNSQELTPLGNSSHQGNLTIFSS